MRALPGTRAWPPQPCRSRYRYRSGHGGRRGQVAAGARGAPSATEGGEAGRNQALSRGWLSALPRPVTREGVGRRGEGPGLLLRPLLWLVRPTCEGASGPGRRGGQCRWLFPFPFPFPVSLLCSGSAAPPQPNLTPRHRQLIPTPCGPVSTPSRGDCLLPLVKPT